MRAGKQYLFSQEKSLLLDLNGNHNVAQRKKNFSTLISCWTSEKVFTKVYSQTNETIFHLLFSICSLKHFNHSFQLYLSFFFLIFWKNFRWVWKYLKSSIHWKKELLLNFYCVLICFGFNNLYINMI